MRGKEDIRPKGVGYPHLKVLAAYLPEFIVEEEPEPYPEVEDDGLVLVVPVPDLVFDELVPVPFCWSGRRPLEGEKFGALSATSLSLFW